MNLPLLQILHFSQKKVSGKPVLKTVFSHLNGRIWKAPMNWGILTNICHEYSKVHVYDQEGHVPFQPAIEKILKQQASVQVFSPVRITRCYDQ